jgi:hypothetical protein
MATLADVGAAQSPAVAAIATIEGSASLVQVEGTRLYVIGDRQLHIFDTVNASSPKRLGGFAFSESILGMTVFDSKVYVAAGVHLLRVIDASNAEAPVERGTAKIKGGFRAFSLSKPNLVVMTTDMEGLEVLDVSNPGAPTPVSTNLFTDSYSQGVAAAGRLVIATDSSTGIYIFDMATPKSPEVIGTLPLVFKRLSKDLPPVVASPEVAIAVPSGASLPTMAVALNKLTGLVEVFDMTNPRKASKTGTIQLSGRMQCLAASGSRAYVGAGDGVHVIDVSRLSGPTETGILETSQPPQSVAVGDDYVFVALGRGGVAIFQRPSQ